METPTSEKDISLELLQTLAWKMKLLDHQASKMESIKQHGSINIIKKLAIDKKDTSKDRNRET